MRILSVSTLDEAGGAEKVARDLVQGFRRHGHEAWLAVGHARHAESDVLQIRRERDHQPRNPAAPPVTSLERIRAERAYGLEDFCFPGTWDLLDLPPARPDLVHCHNLHGGYFDLRVLPWLSRTVATVLTLHDAWLLSGHCAHSFDCERWREGCRVCPDLTIYPAIARDAAGMNWLRKRSLFRQSRLFVASPSRWLLDRARSGILNEGIVDSVVIPNGVDTDVFRPRDKSLARRELGLREDALILLFAANGIRSNPWKDYEGLRETLARLGARFPDRHVTLVGLGDAGLSERVGAADFVLVPFERDPARIARFYQAADVYLHMAKAETFGLVLLEAMSCGLPVAATAVGGIPEIVHTVRAVTGTELPVHGPQTATGALGRPGDAADMAAAVAMLLEDPGLRARLGGNARRRAQECFDLRHVVARYSDWFANAVLPQSAALSAHESGVATSRGVAGGGRKATGRQPVILNYHRIAEPDTDPHLLAVWPARFAEHLAEISRFGRPMALREFLAEIANGHYPTDAVVVTLDDGYADNLLEAMPLLQAASVPATVFVTTGPLDDPQHEPWWDTLERVLLAPGTLPPSLTLVTGRGPYEFQIGAAAHYSTEEARRLAAWSLLSADDPTPRHRLFRILHRTLLRLGSAEARRDAVARLLEWSGASMGTRETHRFMTRDEVARLGEGGFVEVGAHTVHHPFLAALSRAEQEREILDSRALLERVAGRPVTLFAYPFGSPGSYISDTVDIIRSAGFEAAVTTLPGVVHPRIGPFELPRMTVRNWTGPEFSARLTAFAASVTPRVR